MCPGLLHPGRITSTKLRKHVATLFQLADLTEGELEQVAAFLGHNLNVHKEFYRIRQETFSAAKVGKILLAIDENMTDKIVGKKLDEIQFEGIF